MNESAATAGAPGPAADEAAAERIARHFGIETAPARRLADAGYGSVERVQALTRDELLGLGLDAEDAARVEASRDREAPRSGPSLSERGAQDEERLAQQLMDSVRPSGGRRKRAPGTSSRSVDALKKWVEGDDRALEAWIRAAPVPVPLSVPVPPLSEMPVAPAPPPAPVAPGTDVPGPSAAAPPLVIPKAIPIAEREQVVLRWLTDLLERMRSEEFDPKSLLSDLQEMNLKLYEERAKRAQLEEEVEQVKRGTIAVIKYVRSREAIAREESLRDKEAEIADLKLKIVQASSGDGGSASSTADLETAIQAKLSEEFTAREEEYRRRINQVEGELRELKAESASIRERGVLLDERAEELPQAMAIRLKELEGRERELATREGELRVRFEEIRAFTEDRERQKEFLKLKEKQLGEWDLQLRTLKGALEIEARTVEQTRRELDETGIPPQGTRRLEEMKAEVTRREDELRSREVLLKQRVDELEHRVSEGEADSMHRAAVADGAEKRVATGIRRLDDLLFGGLPEGAQVLLNGPAHTGKELLARLFVAEGLRRGVPAIWIVTDKTYTQVREEMAGILPGYRGYEEKGMVRYVDLYSKSLGVTQSEAGVRLLQTTDRALLEQLMQAITAYVQELKERAPTYRLVFESVSTVTAYLDTATTFRFLQPFTGRRKLDGAASYYLLETGMHSDSDLDTLEHMVDGSINLKVEQLKTFLSVRGITDVQSRAWVGYTFTKRGFSLGSFSLDHIR